MSTSRILIQTTGKSFSIDVPEEKADAQFLSVCNFIMECNKATESYTEAAKKLVFRGKKTVYSPRKNTNQKGEISPSKSNSDMPQQETTKGESEQPERIAEEADTISTEPLSFDFASAPEEDKEDCSVGKNNKETYGGFLHIVCEQCGRPFSFSAKTPLSEFECHECGHKTPLHNLGRLKLACECGKVWRYHTNALSRLVELNCIACGSPMIAEMDKHGDYYPLKE